MKMKYTAIDLFSGCGGLTLGLKLAGFNVLAAIESDALTVETYKANHPKVRVSHNDIRTVQAKPLRESLNLAMEWRWSGATIKKTTRANYRDASGAFHSEEELLEKCADSERINARDTNAMTPQMRQPFGVHFQKERMAF
jgi:C-5 cytosine-specific DNA methylase